MMPMLTCEVPSVVAVEHGRYRRVSYVPGDIEYEARPRVVRRIRRADGSIEHERVEVEVFVPRARRAGVEARRDAWLDADDLGAWLRCKALVSKNRKTLRPFLESGELELRTDAD
ncbi:MULTISPECIES: hypothetical protein [unclassified Paraburkholderia]|uniref:hypothetical protein n=1 Tax=unclassified Paraburkholderia TaxID=2615204 RepID=UPI002AAF75D1|nr:MULTISPECIES: hypothetical protein [unclassified Paraburkholderia]